MYAEDIKIEQGKEAHLLGLMYILREYSRYMNQAGVLHWHIDFPAQRIIEKDIEEQNIYCLKYKGILAAFITITNTDMEFAEGMAFDGQTSDTLIVRRMAILPRYLDLNLDKALLEFALEKAKETGKKFLRFQVPESFEAGTKTAQGLNFSMKGKANVSFQCLPFMCFEKQV